MLCVVLCCLAASSSHGCLTSLQAHKHGICNCFMSSGRILQAKYGWLDCPVSRAPSAPSCLQSGGTSGLRSTWNGRTPTQAPTVFRLPPPSPPVACLTALSAEEEVQSMEAQKKDEADAQVNNWHFSKLEPLRIGAITVFFKADAPLPRQQH